VHVLAVGVGAGVMAVGVLMMIAGAFLTFPLLIAVLGWAGLWPTVFEPVSVAIGALVGALGLELAGFSLILVGPRIGQAISRNLLAANARR